MKPPPIDRQAIKVLQCAQFLACWFAAVSGSHFWHLGVMVSLCVSVLVLKGTLGLIDESNPPNPPDHTG
jgi:hypothetical protein